MAEETVEEVRDAVARAIAAFRADGSAADDALGDALMAGGIPEGLATRLVQFVPIACCRFSLGDSGVKFAATYAVMGRRGKLVAGRRLDEEPVYREAMAWLEASGEEPAAFFPIAARTGAFQSIQALMLRGSRLADIATSPPVIREPKSGGGGRPWWRPWG